MNRLKGFRVLALTAAIIGLVLCSFYVTAAERGKGAVNKEMEQNIGLPAMTGEHWQKMTEDSKISFLWGLWSTISIEHYLMNKYPDLKKDNFSSKVIEGTDKSPMTVNETVAMIDKYYQNNPDHLDKPVVGVIWAMVVKPNITVGIAGRPLNPND